MAEHNTYTHGQMEIREQAASFGAFVRFTKWGCLAIAVLVLFSTMMFCTDSGIVASLVAAVVVLAAGVFLLREKPATH